MSKVERWEIPNDGKLHEVSYKGEIGPAVGYLNKLLKSDGVEFWTYDYPTPFDPDQARVHKFQIFRTGQEIPPGFVLRGTTDRPNPVTDVLHLFEKMD